MIKIGSCSGSSSFQAGENGAGHLKVAAKDGGDLLLLLVWLVVNVGAACEEADAVCAVAASAADDVGRVVDQSTRPKDEI